MHRIVFVCAAALVVFAACVKSAPVAEPTPSPKVDYPPLVVSDEDYRRLSGVWEQEPIKDEYLKWKGETSVLSWGNVTHHVHVECIIDLRANPPYILQLGEGHDEIVAIKKLGKNEYELILRYGVIGMDGMEKDYDDKRTTRILKITFVNEHKIYIGHGNENNWYLYKWFGPGLREEPKK